MEAITFSSHGRGQVDFPLFFHAEYKHLVLLSQDKQYKGQKKAALKVLWNRGYKWWGESVHTIYKTKRF